MAKNDAVIAFQGGAIFFIVAVFLFCFGVWGFIPHWLSISLTIVGSFIGIIGIMAMIGAILKS